MLSPGISICSLQESRQVISFDSKHNTFSPSLSLPLLLLCNFHDLFPLYMAHLHHFLCLKKPPSLPSSYLYATEPADNFRGTLVFQRPRNHARFFPSSSSSSTPSSFSHVSRVSTVHVEYPSDKPIPHHDLLREISRLDLLKSTLSSLDNLEDKVKVLDKDPRVVNFFPPAKNGFFSGAVISTLKLGFYELYLLKCLVAAGQEHVLHSDSSWIDLNSRNEGDLNGFESHKSFLKSAFYVLLGMIEKWDLSDNVGRKQERWSEDDEAWEDGDVAMLWKLLRTLEEMEKFYDCIGGIIGYQIIVLELILPSKSDIQAMDWSPYLDDSKRSESKNFYVPHGLDLSENTEYAAQAALWGIEGLPELGEIYPLGGSGDRLGLVDSETGECLPAAMLPYCGRTLLEGLIRDLQAREFLYFKLYGKQCITPLAIMTSSAKNNHKRINALCSRNKWFGRGRKNFQLFEQPVVPAVGGDGRWLINKPFSPVCKPGGHGVIWKLAYDKGIFQWFHDHGRKGATVRQISNVVAATDLTLLALAGIGLHYGKKLGFASCKRNSGATEGINVLVEQKKADGQWAYGLSCIEYTEFEKYGITDAPMSDDGLQAQFPANTNILYIDLAAAGMVGSSRNRACLPGMVLNLKKPIVYVNHHGMRHSVHGGRLECTMQNIADYFLNTYTNRCYDDVEEKLDTYIVFNERKRVTSSAKRKRRHSDKSLHQTPDGSLLDIMRNAYDLLSQCNIKIPKVEDHSHYFHSGPPFLILLHPSLGPLWEVTRQKFNGGYISEGSELQIEVSEFLWKDVQLDGSLVVIAENIMGSSRIGDSDEPTLQYGLRCGRCKLQNVKVLNKGIDWNCTTNVYWKHDVQRFETLKILLRGNAEFEASDVVLEGNHIFEVPNGFKLHVTNGCTGLSIKLDPIKEEMMDSGSWFWKYKLKSPHIQLEMVELQCV